MTAVMPVQDWDQNWVDYDPSAIRLCYNPQAGALVLLLSVDNGDGSHTVHTFNLSGALRDTGKINAVWPAYVQPTDAPSAYMTDSQRIERQQDRALARAEVASPGQLLPPVSGSNTNAGE